MSFLADIQTNERDEDELIAFEAKFAPMYTRDPALKSGLVTSTPIFDKMDVADRTPPPASSVGTSFFYRHCPHAAPFQKKFLDGSLDIR